MTHTHNGDQKRLAEEDYRFIYSRVPRACVDLFIVVEGGFLLAKRDIEPRKGMWHMPGGRLLMRESVADAIRRIAAEEIGVEVSEGKLIGYMQFLDEGLTHSISLVFYVDALTDNISGSYQAQDIRRFSEVPEGMLPEHGEFLREYLRRK